MSIEPCVFIVDDDYAVRDSLGHVMEAAGFAFQTFESAERFLEAYCPDSPGCLLLDLNMPEMNGDELQVELIRRNLHLPIIFLTAYGDIPTTVRAIKTGAVDFLTKPVPTQLLIEHVKTALQQQIQVYAKAAAEQALFSRINALTSRELEIMSQVVAGYSNKEIARHLRISHRTVEIHRARVMAKTGATNLLELARLCEACRLPPSTSTDSLR
jgi:FixJ family two-component response regulator